MHPNFQQWVLHKLAYHNICYNAVTDCKTLGHLPVIANVLIRCLFVYAPEEEKTLDQLKLCVHTSRTQLLQNIPQCLNEPANTLKHVAPIQNWMDIKWMRNWDAHLPIKFWTIPITPQNFPVKGACHSLVEFTVASQTLKLFFRKLCEIQPNAGILSCPHLVSGTEKKCRICQARLTCSVDKMLFFLLQEKLAVHSPHQHQYNKVYPALPELEDHNCHYQNALKKHSCAHGHCPAPRTQPGILLPFKHWGRLYPSHSVP